MKDVAESQGEPYPRVLIIGDANVGGEPEKNQVEFGYFIDSTGDSTGGCFSDPHPYWCPTESKVADFDYDGLGDVQVAWLPVTRACKIALAVQNFVNKVNSQPTHRALFALGDPEWQGISPAVLPELIEDFYGWVRCEWI